MTLLTLREVGLFAGKAVLSPRTITLYLVRHGEAAHNVAEKIARERTLSDAEQRGLSAGHTETRRLMEDARKSVLRDPNFFDAEITEQGRQQSKEAGQQINAWVSEGLKAPTLVVVSPLQRALQTAEEAFPDSSIRIEVREEVRERLTGRPADNRHCSVDQQKKFPRFDFQVLRTRSARNLMEGGRPGISGSVYDRDWCSDQTPSLVTEQRGSSSNCDVEVEDECALRKRAHEFFQVLGDLGCDSVAVVTHKGFLRGLERGCFGVKGSTEFKNCEVRVYQFEMTHGDIVSGSIVRLR